MIFQLHLILVVSSSVKGDGSQHIHGLKLLCAELMYWRRLHKSMYRKISLKGEDGRARASLQHASTAACPKETHAIRPGLLSPTLCFAGRWWRGVSSEQMEQQQTRPSRNTTATLWCECGVRSRALLFVLCNYVPTGSNELLKRVAVQLVAVASAP